MTKNERRQQAALAAGAKAAAEGAAARQGEGPAKVERQVPKLPALPKLPKARKPKPLVACECGCGGTTTRRFCPGHDGRLHGWVLRVERGLVTLDQVEASDGPGTRAAVERVLAPVAEEAVA